MYNIVFYVVNTCLNKALDRLPVKLHTENDQAKVVSRRHLLINRIN